jgi:NAD(P)H-dependent FMN reductase
MGSATSRGFGAISSTRSSTCATIPCPSSTPWARRAIVPLTDEAQLRFARKMGEFDGYIFVTAEYNHTVPGVLSNAL